MTQTPRLQRLPASNHAKFTLSSAALLALALSACSPAPVEQTSTYTPPQANENAVKAHLEFLASDLLEGRDTGARGHEIASAYIAGQFTALGLQPAGTDGYYQRITFRSARLTETQPTFVLHTDSGDHTLEYRKHFSTGASVSHELAEVSAPLVFAGYGVVSEAFGIDDYAGVDVNGKIVITLSGGTEGLPSEEAAHLGAQKSRNAVERGAVGVITLHTPAMEEIRPFERSVLFGGGPRMRWLSPEGQVTEEFSQIVGSAYVDYRAAEPAFENSPYSLEDIFAVLEAGERPAAFELSASASLMRESRFEEITSPNVIAMIEGSDPDLKHEYVIYTAHSDHVGLARDFSSTSAVNNGALDNAAGVAVLIETARMYAEAAAAGHGPRRSILFAAVTAEERGLLGADYFAHHPTVPLEQIVANVNLDMPVLLYPFADVVAFGADHSSLGAVVARAAGQFDIALSPDPMPEQAIFTRSDHYTLVRQGVPAVFLMTGFTSQDPDQDGGEVWGEFFANHYHRPSDDLPSLMENFGGIRYDFGALFTDINFAIGMEIANDDQAPYWLSDSYFGKIFRGDATFAN
ncbi:M28 family metallopeptidase [Aliidiomarina haloalkalitolerans]|uniref:Peptidase M28 n=1 Tax=Aliidiomarina haloalkalitolerans TaxID=859059 RepID=A0A432VR52_9GAMM|nr:M28 family metallopeptidase [Aliidiomarina haloalkalitolerans]RUO18643.1 peptidase M28 [Aliidiomarina haloalkalitolerans]